LKSPQIPQPKIHPSALVAPGAHVYGDVTLDSEVFVLFGAVVRAELDRVVVGSQTNIQDNCVFHCDEGIPALVGSRVTVGHSAVVHGATVGDRALIGIGAKALNGSEVGEGAWLASGSVLPEGKTAPPWTLTMGIPAKPVRDLTEEEIAHADAGVDHYLELLARYREIFA
jgi:carbonic anhydrase/acetyltransferase-like protein (isoleucine patch superfamily)